jgi:hypothetical protein
MENAMSMNMHGNPQATMILIVDDQRTIATCSSDVAAGGLPTTQASRAWRRWT